MRVTHSPCTQNIWKLPCKNTSYLSARKLSKVSSGREWQTLKLSHRMVTVSMRFSKHWPLQASWDVRASMLMMEPAQSPLFWIHIQAIIHASCSHASQFPISKSIPASFWWSTRSFAKKTTAQLSLVISTVICPFSFSNRGCMPSAVAWFRSICHFVDLLKTMSTTSPSQRDFGTGTPLKKEQYKKFFPHERK